MRSHLCPRPSPAADSGLAWAPAPLRNSAALLQLPGGVLGSDRASSATSFPAAAARLSPWGPGADQPGRALTKLAAGPGKRTGALRPSHSAAERGRGVACGSPRGQRGGVPRWGVRGGGSSAGSRRPGVGSDALSGSAPDLPGPARGAAGAGARARTRPLRMPPACPSRAGRPAPRPRAWLLGLQARRTPVRVQAIGGIRRGAEGQCSCAVAEDVGSHLRTPGGPGLPGRGERPPAHMPAVPRAIRAPVPDGLLSRLLCRLPARPRYRRPPRLSSVPVSASKPQ